MERPKKGGTKVPISAPDYAFLQQLAIEKTKTLELPVGVPDIVRALIRREKEEHYLLRHYMQEALDEI